MRQEPTGSKYHIVLTTEAKVYQQWQCILSYESYLTVKRDNPNSDMGGFTRLVQG